MPERKPFDPAVRRLLAEQLASMTTPPPSLDSAERVPFARALMERQLKARTSIEGLPNRVQTREVKLPSGIRMRLYLPEGASAPLPVLVYLHGGGWVVASLETHDPACRLLCEGANVLVASVEYRLAPEHPFPAAVEDTLEAVREARAHAAEWGGDPARIAIGGDSAGGGLAAIAGNILCAAGRPDWLRALLILYPVVDHPSANHPSFTENGTGYGLEANVMRWFWDQYARGVSSDDPRLSPLRLASLPPLPPALVATAEYDCLRDEGIAYARKLAAAGVTVEHVHSPDMGHNFPVTPNLIGRFPQCNETLARFTRWLHEILA